MRRVLHIRTRRDDPWADHLTALQREEEEEAVCAEFDLTVMAPDYEALLDQILSADSIQVW